MAPELADWVPWRCFSSEWQILMLRKARRGPRLQQAEIPRRHLTPHRVTYWGGAS